MNTEPPRDAAARFLGLVRVGRRTAITVRGLLRKAEAAVVGSDVLRRTSPPAVKTRWWRCTWCQGLTRRPRVLAPGTTCGCGGGLVPGLRRKA
jgi:hypothetical protein